MEEETSSADAACSVAPWEICWEEVLICWLPDDTLSAADLMLMTTSDNLSMSVLILFLIVLKSPL